MHTISNAVDGEGRRVIAGSGWIRVYRIEWIVALRSDLIQFTGETPIIYPCPYCLEPPEVLRSCMQQPQRINSTP